MYNKTWSKGLKKMLHLCVALTLMESAVVEVALGDSEWVLSDAEDITVHCILLL
jgi:hypothetical protein